MTIQTPSRVAAATAPATVFGMSWNFRSRNTRSPRADQLLDERRAVAREERLPILKPPTDPRRPSARRAASSGRVDVESNEQLVHAWVVEACRPGPRATARSDGGACSRACRRASFGQMNGSTKFAVPTCTAVAPAIMNSSASRASAMPPMPMIGIFTAWRHSYTIRTAIGRMAGPLRPPDAVRDLRPPRFDVDHHREERVDERHGVGAGVFGRARERGDVGDVRRQLRDERQPRRPCARRSTTSNVPARLQPNWMPPSLMLGQEMFSSMAATPSASDRIRDTSTYSSIVVPQTLTMTVARRGPQLRQLLVRRSGGRRCPAGRSRSACRPAFRRCAAPDALRARRGTAP